MWTSIWTAAKDVLLTGTGLTLILSQVFSKHPSDVLIAAGLALTVPSIGGHTRALLTGDSGSSSSPPSPPAGPPRSGSSSGEGDR